jgi:hypothetical protein
MHVLLECCDFGLEPIYLVLLILYDRFQFILHDLFSFYFRLGTFRLQWLYVFAHGEEEIRFIRLLKQISFQLKNERIQR